MARAQKYTAEAEAVPAQTELKYQEMQFEQVRAASENMSEGDADDKEFEKRLKILSELREDRKLQMQEDQVKIDRVNAASQVEAQNKGEQTLKAALNDDSDSGAPA